MLRFGITLFINYRVQHVQKGIFGMPCKPPTYFSTCFSPHNLKSVYDTNNSGTAYLSRYQTFDARDPCSQPGTAPRSHNVTMPTGISRQFYAEETVDRPVKSDENRGIIIGPLGERFTGQQTMFHENRRENTMSSTKELLDEAMKLKPEERFILVEGLIKSLDEPDKKLDEIWAEESENRLKAYREGKLEGIPMQEIFNEE
ncbi:MAG: addiction module protein [Nitrospira sp.]|nr:addiction module protein [Nitrospira sp.]MCA9455313.1 addiction module protein [Nitrospira sp.]